jgi:hypothetical protein
MSYNWGPHYIVPTGIIKSYSGSVLLRENLDDDLLQKELKEIGLGGTVTRITNPWYFRKKGGDTWIKIGESADRDNNFSVRWDTTGLANGKYEIMGLMHVFLKRDGKETGIARQNVVEIEVEN